MPITRSRRSARHLRLIHGRRAALVGLVAAMVPSSLAVGIPNAPVKTWVPDGQVMSITPGAGSTAYVGGYFDQVGPQTGGSALIDAGTGVASTAWPTIVGDVYAVTPDGAGGWYVAGSFDRVGAEAIRNLAHIGADKTVDATFAPNPDGVVRSVVTKGTDVIIGGDFFVVAGQPRARLASVTAAGSLNAWNPGANGAVGALLVQGSTVYAGGSFTAISGSPRSYLAALDASSGSLIGWGGTPSGPVHALALSGTTLFVGGDFGTMNGQSAPSIAALTAATGASLAGWSSSAGGPVRALLVDSGRLYVGGDFTTLGGTFRGYIGAVSAANGSLKTWAPHADGSVNALTVGGGFIYAGGTFTNIGGQDRKRLASLDPGIDANSATTWNPSAGADVYALYKSGAGVFAGGTFRTIGGVARGNGAQLDLTTGEPTAWDPKANSIINTIAVTPSRVFLGGGFTGIGAQTRNYLAAVDPTTGGALAGWSPSANSEVRSLTTSGAWLYVGGAFTYVNGLYRPRLIAVDTSTGAVRAGWNPAPDDAVHALAFSGGLLYAGGAFQSIGGEGRAHIAAIDQSGLAITGWDPNADNSVNALHLDGARLYATGAFSTIDGQSRSNAAALDVSTGTVDLTWAPNLGGPSADAVAVLDTNVVVGGAFSTIGFQPRSRVGAVRIANAAVDSWTSNASADVRALASVDGKLLVGGAFRSIAGTAQAGFALYVDPPQVASLPSILGVPAVGSSLTCVPGTWQRADSRSYLWLRDGAPIAGQAATTYSLAPTDAGHLVACKEVTANLAGTGAAQSSSVSVVGPPVNTAPPSIAGATTLGAVLDCRPGTWTGDDGEREYRWKRDGVDISGGSGRTRSIRRDDTGHTLTCVESAANYAAAAEVVSAGVAIPALPPEVPPTGTGSGGATPEGPTTGPDSLPDGATVGTLGSLAGKPIVGRTVACPPGQYGESPAYVLVWRRNGVTIPGGVGGHYGISWDDVGKTLSCTVTRVGGDGTPIAYSPRTNLILGDYRVADRRGFLTSQVLRTGKTGLVVVPKVAKAGTKTMRIRLQAATKGTFRVELGTLKLAVTFRAPGIKNLKVGIPVMKPGGSLKVLAKMTVGKAIIGTGAVVKAK